jgi:uncharacterized protein YbgA (DUF1722 family)
MSTKWWLLGIQTRDAILLRNKLQLVRHYLRKLNVEYFKGQIHLDPCPEESNLLNQL